MVQKKFTSKPEVYIETKALLGELSENTVAHIPSHLLVLDL